MDFYGRISFDHKCAYEAIITKPREDERLWIKTITLCTI